MSRPVGVVTVSDVTPTTPKLKSLFDKTCYDFRRTEEAECSRIIFWTGYGSTQNHSGR